MGFRWSGVQIPPARPITTPRTTTTYESHPQSAKSLNRRSVPSSAPGNSSALRAEAAESSAILTSEVSTTHGSRDHDLAYRDRRRTRRAIPDHRALGESPLVSPAEDEALAQAHLLRPRRGESRTRCASDESPARRVGRVKQRGGGARPRGQHLKGFRYDEAAGLAYFSVYLSGSGGELRHRATVEAATWEEAVSQWTEFRARALKGEARPGHVLTFATSCSVFLRAMSRSARSRMCSPRSMTGKSSRRSSGSFATGIFSMRCSHGSKPTRS